MWIKTHDNTLIADIDGMSLRENRGQYQLVGFCKNGREIIIHSWEWPHFALDRIEAFAKFAETGAQEVFILDLPEDQDRNVNLSMAEKTENYYFPG